MVIGITNQAPPPPGGKFISMLCMIFMFLCWRLYVLCFLISGKFLIITRVYNPFHKLFSHPNNGFFVVFPFFSVKMFFHERKWKKKRKLWRENPPRKPMAWQRCHGRDLLLLLLNCLLWWDEGLGVEMGWGREGMVAIEKLRLCVVDDDDVVDDDVDG